MKLEDNLERFSKFCAGKFAKGEKDLFAQGFITATLVFCVGAMAIVGALEDGINHNVDILYAKSLLDGIAGMIFASTMGAGVLLAAVPVALYQGLITAMSAFGASFLPDEVIIQMSYIGSVLIFAIGLNMLKISKIKISNLLPAVLIPLLYFVIQQIF